MLVWELYFERNRSKKHVKHINSGQTSTFWFQIWRKLGETKYCQITTEAGGFSVEVQFYIRNEGICSLNFVYWFKAV